LNDEAAIGREYILEPVALKAKLGFPTILGCMMSPVAWQEKKILLQVTAEKRLQLCLRSAQLCRLLSMASQLTAYPAFIERVVMYDAFRVRKDLSEDEQNEHLSLLKAKADLEASATFFAPNRDEIAAVDTQVKALQAKMNVDSIIDAYAEVDGWRDLVPAGGERKHAGGETGVYGSLEGWKQLNTDPNKPKNRPWLSPRAQFIADCRELLNHSIDYYVPESLLDDDGKVLREIAISIEVRDIQGSVINSEGKKIASMDVQDISMRLDLTLGQDVNTPVVNGGANEEFVALELQVANAVVEGMEGEYVTLLSPCTEIEETLATFKEDAFVQDDTKLFHLKFNMSKLPSVSSPVGGIMQGATVFGVDVSINDMAVLALAKPIFELVSFATEMFDVTSGPAAPEVVPMIGDIPAEALDFQEYKPWALANFYEPDKYPMYDHQLPVVVTSPAPLKGMHVKASIRVSNFVMALVEENKFSQNGLVLTTSFELGLVSNSAGESMTLVCDDVAVRPVLKSSQTAEKIILEPRDFWKNDERDRSKCNFDLIIPVNDARALLELEDLHNSESDIELHYTFTPSPKAALKAGKGVQDGDIEVPMTTATKLLVHETLQQSNSGFIDLKITVVDFALNVAKPDFIVLKTLVGSFVECTEKFAVAAAKDRAKKDEAQKIKLEALQTRRDDELNQMIENTFKGYDKDGSGNLDEKEVRHLVEDVTRQFNLTQSELKLEMAEFRRIVDADGDGLVDLDELKDTLMFKLKVNNAQRSGFMDLKCSEYKADAVKYWERKCQISLPTEEELQQFKWDKFEPAKVFTMNHNFVDAMENIQPWRDIKASVTGRKTYVNNLSDKVVEAFSFEVELRDGDNGHSFEKVGACTRTFAEFERFRSSLPVAIARNLALARHVKQGFQLFGGESDESIEARRLNEMQEFLNRILASEQLWLQDGKRTFDFICPPTARRNSTLSFKAPTGPMSPTPTISKKAAAGSTPETTGEGLPDRSDPTVIEEDPYPAVHLFHEKRQSWEAFKKVWSPLDETPAASRMTNLWQVLLWDIGLLKNVNGGNNCAVQKMMVRSLRNYTYSQQVWKHVVVPLFVKKWPGPIDEVRKGITDHRWILTPDTLCGGRVLMNASIASVLQDEAVGVNSAVVPYGTGVVQDALTIRMQVDMAGMYVRLLDNNLNKQQPLLQFAVENAVIEVDIENHCGMAIDDTSKFDLTLFVNLSGDFFNRKSAVRICEPYLEPCLFSMKLFKLQHTPADKVDGGIYHVISPIPADDIPKRCKHADQFMNINVTSQLLSNLVVVGNIFGDQDAEGVEKHIADVDDGAFYLVNETGLGLKFAVKACVKNEVPCFLDPPIYESMHDEEEVLPNKARRVCALRDVAVSRNSFASIKWKELRQEFDRADRAVSKDGSLDAKEAKFLLTRLLTKHQHEDAIGHADLVEEEMIIDRFMKKADKNASGKVSWMEFREAVEEWSNESGSILEIKIEGFEPFHCDYNNSGGQLVQLVSTSVGAFADTPIEAVVDCSVSNTFGSVITIRSPLAIKNSCHKATEVLMTHARGSASYTVKPNELLHVPLQSVNNGSTMRIRQVNEEKWSATSLSLNIPDAAELSPWSKDLKERSHLYKERLDGQPIRYLRKQLHRRGGAGAQDWSIEILPQIVMWSSLPVEFEYKVAQLRKPDMRKRRSMFEIERAIKDSFKGLGEVNARVGNIASGESAHVFGLDIMASAYLRLSLFNGEDRLELEQDFELPLRSQKDMNFTKKLSFYKTSEDVNAVNRGGSRPFMEVQIQSTWVGEQPHPTVKISAPVWVLNKTGLPLDCSIWAGKNASAPSFVCEERAFKHYFDQSLSQSDVEELCKEMPLMLYATKSSQFAVKVAGDADENENNVDSVATKKCSWNQNIGSGRVAMNNEVVTKTNSTKPAWSTRSLLSLPGSSFELYCPDGVAVSLDLQALPGVYEGTILATLYVPYTVVNTLNIPIQIYPAFERGAKQ
jgi:Ca2+-binding EF-hand superfamily protein